MKRHAHIPKLLWYVLLSVLFVSLLLLSACDSNNPPSETTAESVEQTAEEIYLANAPVEGVRQGDVCSIKIFEPVHRGDKLYKEIDRCDRQ